MFDKRSCCDYEQSQMPMQSQGMYDSCCAMGPVQETPIETCVQRDIIHTVQHICPINTRIINNHIFRHTYAPQYSCCEQNVVTNLDEGSCCNFL